MGEDVEKNVSPRKTGPGIARSEKETRGYGKRIILVFLLSVGAVIALITFQTKFKIGDLSDENPMKNYRIPPATGFAELAASMRRDRQVERVVETIRQPSRNRTQRVVIEGKREKSGKPEILPVRTVPVRPVPPRYYSNNDDAQLAQTLRTLKLQAITAKPIIENFDVEGSDVKGTQPQPQNQGVSGVMADLSNMSRQITESAAMAALTQQQGQPQDPNGQAGKQSFLRDGGGSMTPQGYSESLPLPQRFPYELKAGTIIPGLLITGINSDLPGNVLGQVSENVWDTATGRHVLIPKGTRILGVYDSEVSYGQRRVLLVWNRLVFPNGTTLDIAGSPGIDQAGYSGLSGRVNEHWGTMFKSALIASMFVAGAEIVYDGDSNANSENKRPRDVAAESLASSILNMGTKIMNKASDIQPTISIRPGKKMGIFVQKDVVFPFPYF
ncbi:MAG: TrbI/VirB10 family protein [Synergistaceae bacterium]|jgi:type IV secretory pathway VirB10-like protein|nr:TrbI/VirB10 family protein [Synergistaceae bacterium]